MMVAILRSNGLTVFNPPADEVVQGGNSLIVIGRLGTSDHLAQLW